MIRPVVTDPLSLSRPSTAAVPSDLPAAQDLLDTLRANADRCAGMAANMIGVHKTILAFDNNGAYMVMFNPKITKKTQPYMTREGCLSVPGIRAARRYRTIEVAYYDRSFTPKTASFSGWTAQIIQHEIDHFLGKLI